MNDRASSMLFCVPSPPSDPFPIAFRNLIHHQDAVKNIARYTKCPLLILSGGKDNLVPSSSNTEFLTRLAEHYSDFPERLQVKEDEDAGHQVTEFMKKEALDFFQNFLNGINPNL